MDEKYRSRKFMLAVTSLALASFFLGLDKLSGSEWVMITAGILGLYGYNNVQDKRNEAKT